MPNRPSHLEAPGYREALMNNTYTDARGTWHMPNATTLQERVADAVSDAVTSAFEPEPDTSTFDPYEADAGLEDAGQEVQL